MSGFDDRKLAELSKQLVDAIGRFKLGKEMAPQPAVETSLPAINGFPSMTEQVTASDEEIKLGFIE